MSVEFLDLLEERVRAAMDRIEALAGENEELRHRVSELEAELAAARSSSAPGWKKERAEIKKRVEGLVDRLSSLLSAAEAGPGDPLV